MLSEIIFITRLFLLKVLSTPQSKLFVCLFKCLYIRTLSTVLYSETVNSILDAWNGNQMFVNILYIFTIGVSYQTSNNGEKTNNLTNLEITRSYHTVFSGVFLKLDLSKPGVKQDFHLYSVSFYLTFLHFFLLIYAVNISKSQSTCIHF